MAFTVIGALIWFGLCCLVYWAIGRGDAPVEVDSYASVFVPVLAYASLTAPGYFAAGHTVMPAPAGIAILAQLVFSWQSWQIMSWNAMSILFLGFVLGATAVKTGRKIVRAR